MPPVETELRAVLAVTAPRLPAPELDAAVTAGALAHARAAADPRAPVAGRAHSAGIAAATAAAARAGDIARTVPARRPDEPPQWLGAAGLVVPILGATPGVGVSVVAAALFDALDAAGLAVLLVDTAEPSRSGLAEMAREAPTFGDAAPDVSFTAGHRGGGYVHRLVVPPSGVFTAGMVPAPHWWLPNRHPPDVTIIDLGWDPWPLAAYPLRGPGAWLETSPSTPTDQRQHPVLVCAPTRPSLARGEQVLTRLRPWTRSQQVVPPAGLIVSGARRWPRGVSGAGGRELARLGPATFLPHHHDVEVGGIGPDPLPLPLRRAATRIATQWGLL